MTTYSFSQISTYLQCPRKYQYRYLDKVKVKEFETTYELILGSLVHQALEWWYQHLTNSPQNSLFPPQIPTKQELLTYFAHHREKEIRNQRAIREPSYFTPEDIRRRAETYLSTYYDQHSDFSDIIAVETEKSILFTLPNGQSFKGIIDRLDHLKDGTLVINDYKTGKKLPVEIENQYISQLSLYAYGLQQQFWTERKIKARLSYLHFGIDEEWEISQFALEIEVKLEGIAISQIEIFKKIYQDKKKPLPTQESPLCWYCEYQSSCPLFKRKYMTESDFSPDEKELVPLIDKYATLSKQISEHKKQVEQNKKLIIDYMQSNELCALTVDDILLKLSSRRGIDLPDTETLEKWLHEKGLWEQTSSLTRFKVASLIHENIVLALDLGESIENIPYSVLSVAKK